MQTLFTVKDKKATGYSPVFQKPTAGLAEREMCDIARDPQSQLAKYPQDFALYAVGTWDETSAQIKAHETPVFVAEVADLIKQQQ